ncbi:MAG TPA: peptidylprolyl isomerase [Humisphaera sp.]|nr:peptidylprolyl isomerase [Humisphaera sp.]
MKYVVGAIVFGMTFLIGCGENGSPPDGDLRAASLSAPDRGGQASGNLGTNSPALSAGAGMDDPVVTVNGQPLTMRQLVGPLIESHGLTVLLNLVQLELAREDAAKQHIVVAAKDFEDEREATLERLCKNADEGKYLDAIDRAVARKDLAEADTVRKQLRAEREEFLTQFLDNQHVDRVEFDIVMKINMYLRKIAEPQIAGRITDEALHRAFGQMYGEKIHVRYIELNNLDEVGQAKRRLAAGDRFEDVARDMSHNTASGSLGGDLPAFTRESTGLPDVFKDMAFSLKDGEVSDALVLGKTYILMKRIELIPPKHVKFENQKPIVYNALYSRLLETVVKKLKQDLAAQVIPSMHFADPSSVLAIQFKARTEMQAEGAKRAREDLDRRQQLINSIKAGTTQPATEPATTTAPATRAAPQAGAAAAGERPPAPKPGPTTLPALPKLVPDTQPAVVPATSK